MSLSKSFGAAAASGGGGGGMDLEWLHHTLLEHTSGPWRPVLAPRRRRPSASTNGLPSGPLTVSAPVVETVPGYFPPVLSNFKGETAAVTSSSRFAAARRVRRRAKASANNLGDYHDFLLEQAPEPPSTHMGGASSSTTSTTTSSTERLTGNGPSQVAESCPDTDFAKGSPEEGVAPLRDPEYLNKRGRKELKR